MLERINKTNDVKKLNNQEKIELAKEIRHYILSITSKNGGHLASNLGTVELTIALESVFDPNIDKIIWDVGHQSYTHKILNGRKKALKTLRKLDGISGFPKTNESATDCFNTGHSSTSISAALGMATARDLNKDNYNVIAVIGDGALTGGMAMEALNHAGQTKKKMIIILNDNEMSISPNIGGINNLLTRLRTRKYYRTSNDIIREFIIKLPLIGKYIVNIISGIKKAIKQLIIPGMYFEEIGLRYVGPVDGHNISNLESIFNEVKKLDGPTIIHVLTKKGKGYKFAEKTPSKYHGVSAFDIKTGKPLKEKATDYSKVFGKKLVKLAEENNNIVAITAAMTDGTGLTKFSKRFPNRFYDVGIAEQHAITFAAGLASSGIISFVSIYSSFYQRCYDQIIHDVCTQDKHVIMCVDRAGIVGADGETHQGILDMAFFRCIPNLIIMAPKDFKELRQMMNFAVITNHPIVIRYPRGGEKIKFNTKKKIILGKSEILREGYDITIITIGTSVSKGYIISNKLKEHNISCELINARFIKPFDKDKVKKSLLKTKKAIVIEDGTILGGLSTIVKELVAENNINLNYFKCYAYNDIYVPHGTNDELEHKYHLDNEFIIDEYLNSNIE